MVERIPPMERLNGFSALEKEKGIFREFKDSLTDNKFLYIILQKFNFKSNSNFDAIFLLTAKKTKL